jgi:hypothetical protein
MLFFFRRDEKPISRGNHVSHSLSLGERSRVRENFY